MDKDVVLKVDGLYKKFTRSLKLTMLYGSVDILRSFLGIPYRTDSLRKGEFWALENVSFELRRGESLGIIGQNGCGKSTLLRLINGIFPPDDGRVLFKGRIGALIAVGAGFHPNMTGYENIYLNGTILGMTRKQIDKIIDDIIEFADIGDFLDAPVSTYSSGMKMKLGFAIAIHCEPDILLVDEVLSVGDITFRNKSLRKMAEIREKSNGVIFISHQLEQVRNLCSRVIVMDHGRIVFDGDTHEGLVVYEELAQDQRVLQNNKIKMVEYQCDESVVKIDSFGIVNAEGNEVDSIGFEDPLIGFIDFEVKVPIEEVVLTFALRTESGYNVLWIKNNDFDKIVLKSITPGKYRGKVQIGKHNLNTGVYFISLAIANAITLESYTKIHSQKSFSVKSDGRSIERGVIKVDEEWSLSKI